MKTMGQQEYLGLGLLFSNNTNRGHECVSGGTKRDIRFVTIGTMFNEQSDKCDLIDLTICTSRGVGESIGSKNYFSN